MEDPTPEEFLKEELSKIDRNITLEDSKQEHYIEDELDGSTPEVILIFFEHVQDEQGADHRDSVDSRCLSKIVNDNRESNTLGLSRSDWQILKGLFDSHLDSFGEKFPSFEALRWWVKKP